MMKIQASKLDLAASGLQPLKYPNEVRLKFKVLQYHKKH